MYKLQNIESKLYLFKIYSVYQQRSGYFLTRIFFVADLKKFASTRSASEYIRPSTHIRQVHLSGFTVVPSTPL